MRRPPAVVLCVLVAGCTPRVLVDSAGDGGDTESSTGGGSTEVDESGVTGTTVSTSGGPTDPSVPPPTTNSGVLDIQVGGDFPPVVEECWQQVPLFEAPLQTIVVIGDQDGDLVPEIWVQNIGNGPGESSPVYAVDATGSIVTEVTIGGVLRGLGDVDGDGLLEINLFAFGGGPPSAAYLPSSGPFSFEVAPLAFAIPFDFLGTDGFFDRTQDGAADAFRAVGEELELLRGNGDGTFETASVIPFPSQPGIRALPVEDTAFQAVVHTAEGFNGGQPQDCIPRDYALMQVGTMGELIPLGQAEPGLELGQFYRAHLPSDGNVAEIFVGTCQPGVTTYDVRRLSPNPDFSSLVETPLVAGKVWAGVFDYDGDGILDLAYADDFEGEIVVENRVLGEDPILTGLFGGEVAENRVYAGDFDGDGREELLRVIANGDTDAHVYERIFFGPCP